MNRTDAVDTAVSVARRKIEREKWQPAAALQYVQAHYGLSGRELAEVRLALSGHAEIDAAIAAKPAGGRGPGRDWRRRAYDERFGGAA